MPEHNAPLFAATGGPGTGGPPEGAPSVGGSPGGSPAGGPPAGGPPAGGPPAGPPAGGPPSGGPPIGGPPTGAPPGLPSLATQPPGNDPITGVLNLAGFGKAFVELAEGERQENMALWYIDVRNFRSINPKYGYLIGNEVLTMVANGIRDLLSKDLPITRLGGDRFVLLTAVMDYEEAHKAYLKLIDYVNTHAVGLGLTARLTLVAGIYYLREWDFSKRDFKRALDYASIAHRKAQGNPQSTLVLFTEEDLERDNRRIIIEQTIDKALAENQVEVWFQAQIDYRYGEVVGAEALARWNHPELGWISPAEFVPVLENAGKVHDLDLYIWEEACRSASEWRSAADSNPVPISVNVSRAEMFEPGLLEHFQNLKKKYRLPDDALHIEITESAFVDEADRLYQIIKDMRAHNMVIEMDDFGSGLSSLHMLKDVPVDVVKLDMGFVQSGVDDGRGAVVLSSVIRMLQGLDTPIIAEGVESLQQAEMLKNMGCHLMQGFHFSRPMPLKEFERFVESNKTTERAEHSQRNDSHLEYLMRFNDETSYLFNKAIGGTMFFFVLDDTSESIIVNDQFYEECGLSREVFGDTRINPIEEIGEESRQTMWRAAAEAREFGSAMCTARVKKTNRWIEACMRYLGTNERGLIFSLNICRSGAAVERESTLKQAIQDSVLTLNMLEKVAPNGFVKCMVDDHLTMDYISASLVTALGHDFGSFAKQFHNRFLDLVTVQHRSEVLRAAQRALETGDFMEMDITVYAEMGLQRHASIAGRMASDVTDDSLLYLYIALKGYVQDDDIDSETAHFDRIIPFEYSMEEDLLVVYTSAPDGSSRNVVLPNWCATLNDMPEFIDPASAAKVLAMVRDFRHHPVTGFADIKCNIRGGSHMRWYHVNYVCDANENGETVLVRGQAQDANDKMGSTKWWREQAEICQLTKLLNRNAVEQKINLLLRQHSGGIMFMIDLDGFKRVNDDLGHLEGDDLLRQVGKALKTCFREHDALGRYGGDEFVAFVPPPREGDAIAFANKRAYKVIEAISTIKIADGTRAACSVGVAICKTADSSFYDMLEVADKALYMSKEAGKKQATVLEMPVKNE